MSPVEPSAWRTVVLVEGASDQVAVEVLAERLGIALAEENVLVVATGGATNFGRFLSMYGPHGQDVKLAGLYDSPAEQRIRRSLSRAGVMRVVGNEPLESVDFFRCVTDLEDELIRTLGAPRVEEVIAAEGELRSLRLLQGMPFHRERAVTEHLHRFIGSRSGRKYRYARALTLALDLDDLPPPLAALFGVL